MTAMDSMTAKIKVVKKIIVKPGMKIVAGFFRNLFEHIAAAAAGPMANTEEPAFMTFIIKVNPRKSGWQKAIISVLQNCKGVRFKMDGDGIVEISGVSNPNKLLKKLSSSKLRSKVELHWFQFGQCCTNLYMPEPPSSSAKKQQQQQSDNPNHLDPPPPHHPSYSYVNDHLPFGDDYVYHHPQNDPHHQLQLQQVFNPYYCYGRAYY